MRLRRDGRRAGNVLVKKCEGKWKFYFLDNERTRRTRKISFAGRKKNLVQLNMLESGGLMRTDRMRFFRAYLEADTGAAAIKKKLATAVVRRTRERLGKEGMRG